MKTPEDSQAYAEDHLKVVRWWIRNMGARGFGQFSDLQPRKIFAEKMELLPGFTDKDIEY